MNQHFCRNRMVLACGCVVCEWVVSGHVYSWQMLFGLLVRFNKANLWLLKLLNSVWVAPNSCVYVYLFDTSFNSSFRLPLAQFIDFFNLESSFHPTYSSSEVLPFILFLLEILENHLIFISCSCIIFLWIWKWTRISFQSLILSYWS
jgi:hypothetical protein